MIFPTGVPFPMWPHMGELAREQRRKQKKKQRVEKREDGEKGRREN